MLIGAAKQPAKIIANLSKLARAEVFIMSGDKSIRGAVIIPMLRALVTGLLFALFGAAWFVDAISWRVFFVVLSGAALLSWLAVILSKVQSTALNGTSMFHYPQTTKIEITAKDPSGAFMAGRFADLPISLQDLAVISKRLQAGSSFSHAGLAGPGRPLSRSQYETLRDEFIARGLAYWRDPSSHAQGVELTRAGRAVMRHFATEIVQVLPIGNSLPQLTDTLTRVKVLQSAAHAHRRTGGNGKEVLLRD